MFIYPRNQTFASLVDPFRWSLEARANFCCAYYRLCRLVNDFLTLLRLANKQHRTFGYARLHLSISVTFKTRACGQLGIRKNYIEHLALGLLLQGWDLRWCIGGTWLDEADFWLMQPLKEVFLQTEYIALLTSPPDAPISFLCAFLCWHASLKKNGFWPPRDGANHLLGPKVRECPDWGSDIAMHEY